METTPLSDADLDRMAARVDEQLRSLRAMPRTVTRGFTTVTDTATLLDTPEQRKVVEQATSEPFETIWQKYRRHLEQDLCLEGGVLHDQWKQFRDVQSKTVVGMSYGWLIAMGVAPASLAPAAIAISVIALNVALKIGIDVFCEDCVKAAGKSDR